MARISQLPAGQWDAGLRAISDHGLTPIERASLGIMAHAPEMARAFYAFGGALSQNRTLPARLIELVRLRISFHNQCRTCMAVRYQSALDDGLTEDMVCSLERPFEAPDLDERDKVALRYADLSATDHLGIDDATFAELRTHFSEAEIVELGMFIAFFIGFGRLSATWDVSDELPASFHEQEGRTAPWLNQAVAIGA